VFSKYFRSNVLTFIKLKQLLTVKTPFSKSICFSPNESTPLIKIFFRVCFNASFASYMDNMLMLNRKDFPKKEISPYFATTSCASYTANSSEQTDIIYISQGGPIHMQTVYIYFDAYLRFVTEYFVQIFGIFRNIFVYKLVKQFFLLN